MDKRPSELAYDMLTADDDGRVCEDIPESACNAQPQNFMTHVMSLTMTKAADGLIDPKLVLSWLLTTLGAPAFFIGMLVPVREAGALLPQLFTAGYIRKIELRKWVWALGSFVQGLSAIGIAVAALYLSGQALGVAVVGLLALLALARSVCSVSYKDVLGKTVAQSRRGTATGTASSVAASIVIIFAVTMMLNVIDKMSFVTAGLFAAGVLWVTAAILFVGLKEDKNATEGGQNPLMVAKENIDYLISDRQLQLFIAVRGLLIATALAPPYMVALAAREGGAAYSGLGLLILASSAAALCSSYVWGRLADKSSRKVLMYAAVAAAVTLALLVVLNITGFADTTWMLPLLLFGLMIAYQGVRLGRSTHLVDMAAADKRATYTALSNTIIGLLLILGGVFSVIAQYYGELVVIGIFAIMCLFAVYAAYSLDEEQQ